MDRKSFEEHVIHGDIDFPVGIYTINKQDEVVIPLHYHKEFEFLILTNGKAKVQLENTAVCLNSSEGVFVNSETLHSAVNMGNTACSFVAIVFSPNFITSEYDNIYIKFVRPIIKNELALTVKLSNEVAGLAMETLNLFNTANFGYELAIKGNIARMLSICIANAEKQRDFKIENKFGMVKNVLDYIHINYGNAITLYDLSLQAHTSKEYLCRIFQEVSDVSPIVYLNRYRVMQSAYMLRSTDKPIAEISACCGFNNSSYFNKIFMRFMKCTPTEYRRDILVGLQS